MGALGILPSPGPARTDIIGAIFHDPDSCPPIASRAMWRIP